MAVAGQSVAVDVEALAAALSQVRGEGVDVRSEVGVERSHKDEQSPAEFRSGGWAVGVEVDERESVEHDGRAGGDVAAERVRCGEQQVEDEDPPSECPQMQRSVGFVR